tara:strand:- start:49 stop:582 length:534 start_codon:yes stop_codon:yes gene_type:complete
MGDSNDPSPLYNYGGNSAAKRYTPMEKQGPLNGNAFIGAKVDAEKSGKKTFTVGDETFPLKMKGNPLLKIGDPNKKMDRLSAKHKSLYDRFEMGQTSEKEEQKMFRLEDRMDKVGARINKKSSPANNNGGTRNSGDAPKKMSAEDEAKLRVKNRARIDKRDAMIADKKAKGVYPKNK